VLAVAKGPILSGGVSEGPLQREMHRTIKKVTQDVERMAFNTAISALMVYANFLTTAGAYLGQVADSSLFAALLK